MCNSSIRLYYIIVFMEGKQEAVILNQNLDKLIELLRVNNYYCTPLSVNRSKIRRCFFLEKKYILI